MVKVLAINGSYREDGITDQAVEAMAQAVRFGGNEVEVVLLREYPLGFCLNCRECTLTQGEQPGECVQQDGMADLVKKLEQADAYILASPTNFGTVTALFKRFMERLTVYAYWPWGAPAPKYRKDRSPRKKAILISSCASPGLMGRLFYNTRKQLATTARTLGADTVGTLFSGLIATEEHGKLPERTCRKMKTMAAKLIN